MNDLPEQSKLAKQTPPQVTVMQARRLKQIEQRKVEKDERLDGKEAFDELLGRAAKPKS